jgi:hypothetical protein
MIINNLIEALYESWWIFVLFGLAFMVVHRAQRLSDRPKKK